MYQLLTCSCAKSRSRPRGRDDRLAESRSVTIPMRVYRDDQKFLTFRINALLWAIVGRLRFPGRLVLVRAGRAGREVPQPLRSECAARDRHAGQARTDPRPQRQKILADNQPAYSLVARPRDHAADREGRPDASPESSSPSSPHVLGVPPQEIEARFEKGKAIPITQSDSDRRGSDACRRWRRFRRRRSPFPELNVEPVQRRNYPYATMAAHVMGFIGEVNEKDLAAHKDLKQGDLIGKRGVELMYDEYLRGRDGAQYWEYDSHGRRLAEYRPARKEPVAGDNVYLTIDFDLQRRAEQYFIENEFVGAAVALDPRNGEVLAMVSSPGVQSERLLASASRPTSGETIASNPFKVELNRAIQGLYSPGSVFKAVMAMAGLSEGAIDTGTSFYCGGSGVFFGRRFRC